MTKEEIMALSKEEKEQLLSFLQETQVEQETEVETQGVDGDSSKENDPESQEKSVELETKVETKDEQSNEKEGEQVESKEVLKETDENTNKNDTNDSNDIKKYGKQLEDLMEKQAETLKKLEEYAKVNDDLKTELQEIKKRSPLGNFNPQPSDDNVSKVDKDRDSFVERYKNAYKN